MTTQPHDPRYPIERQHQLEYDVLHHVPPSYAQQQYVALHRISPKNPLLHAVVSALVPGVGSMMAGQVVFGLAFLSAFVVLPVAAIVAAGAVPSAVTALGLFVGLPLTLFTVWLVSIWHAHSAAQQWNRERGIES